MKQAHHKYHNAVTVQIAISVVKCFLTCVFCWVDTDHTEFRCFPHQEAGKQENLHGQYTISEDREMWEDHKQTIMCFQRLNGPAAHNS